MGRQDVYLGINQAAGSAEWGWQGPRAQPGRRKLRNRAGAGSGWWHWHIPLQRLGFIVRRLRALSWGLP